MKKIDLIGKKFGRLTVLYENGRNKYKSVIWHCLCDCGNECDVDAPSLKNNNTKSCGCLISKNAKRQCDINNINTNIYDLSGNYGICKIKTGESFIFDLEDYNKIKDYTWYIHNGYVIAHRKDDTTKFCYLQNLIMDNIDGDLIVDHICDEDKLDNRKCNLRFVTKSENGMNRKLNSNNKSGITGVCWNKTYNKWTAMIMIDGKSIFLGYYINKEDAIRARKNAEEKYYGDYSYDNSQKIANKNKKEND